MNIVFIGYRGTGKSTIGRRLAAELGRGFVDTDVGVTERAGQTIRQIFEMQGEQKFRDLESAVIAEIAAKTDHVIAVGGGAILRPENVAALKSTGRIIWLRADPGTLHARIMADTATAQTRPNLAGGGLEEITALLLARTPLYQAAADMTLDVSRLSIDDAITRLLPLL